MSLPIGQLDRDGLEHVISGVVERWQQTGRELTKECFVMRDLWLKAVKNDLAYTQPFREGLENARYEVLANNKPLTKPLQLLMKKQDELQTKIVKLEKLLAQKNPHSSEAKELKKQIDSLRKQSIVLKRQIEAMTAQSKRNVREFTYKGRQILAMQERQILGDQQRIQLQDQKIEALYLQYRSWVKLYENLSAIYNEKFAPPIKSPYLQQLIMQYNNCVAKYNVKFEPTGKSVS